MFGFRCLAFGFQHLAFGVWWVSAIEIEDFWWVLRMWVTRFQGLFGGDGGGGGGGSFC